MPDVVKDLRALIKTYAELWGFDDLDLAFIETLPPVELVKHVQETTTDGGAWEPTGLIRVRHALILRVLADTEEVLKEIER